MPIAVRLCLLFALLLALIGQRSVEEAGCCPDEQPSHSVGQAEQAPTDDDECATCFGCCLPPSSATAPHVELARPTAVARLEASPPRVHPRTGPTRQPLEIREPAARDLDGPMVIPRHG